MYLPYGVNQDGQLVYIESVPRGRTALHCPYCNMPLIARKGARIAAHFAHDGKTCRPVSRSGEAIALPMYDGFRLHLSGKTWEALRSFHDEQDDSECDRLETHGLVKGFRTRYGTPRYELTHKGKVPFGELSLDLFNKFQRPLIVQKHEALEMAALMALCTPKEVTAVTDLKVFRAQVRRILEATLYFIEIRTSGGAVLHKIGVTARPLEQRMAEIRADLLPHFGAVELKPLGTWAQRGNVELYFKHRYRRFRHMIGTLTEYFAFEDVKPILRDLRRMRPWELSDVEHTILNGASSRVEQGILAESEMLSAKGWRLLCAFDGPQEGHAYMEYDELRSYRLGKNTERLILSRFATGSFKTVTELTSYGQAYRDRFAAQYQRRYGAVTRCGASLRVTASKDGNKVSHVSDK